MAGERLPRREAINPPTLFDSLQYGFSQAIAVDGGRRVLLSGQVATDEGGATTEGTLAGQLEIAFDNIERLLGAAGGSLQDVAVLRIYLVESVREELDPVVEALKGRFPGDPPASTWLVVSGFARDDWLVEIEAEAFVPASPPPSG